MILHGFRFEPYFGRIEMMFLVANLRDDAIFRGMSSMALFIATLLSIYMVLAREVLGLVMI